MDPQAPSTTNTPPVPGSNPAVNAAPRPSDWPGIEGIISQTWAGLKLNIKTIVIYSMAVGVAAILDALLGFKPDAEGPKSDAYLASGGPFGAIVTLATFVGVYLLGLAIADKKVLPLARLVTIDMRWLYLLGALILATLGTLLGLLLFIVPGIILALMWAVAPYGIADRRLGPIEALKDSARLTKGYRLRIFLLMLLSLVLIVPMILLFAIPFLGSFVAAAVTVFFYGAGAVIYRALQSEKGAELSAAPASPAAPSAPATA